jgi:prepilin-type N-terminal cleavage/methylation domain-containing protein
MRQRIRAMKQNESGFTLIELLIVIVILGVLAGVVVFAVSGITDRGVEAACKADKKTIEVAVEAYYAKESKYPAGSDDATRLGALKTAGLIKDVPSSDKYTITLDTDGVVGPTTCPKK